MYLQHAGAKLTSFIYIKGVNFAHACCRSINAIDLVPAPCKLKKKSFLRGKSKAMSFSRELDFTDDEHSRPFWPSMRTKRDKKQKRWPTLIKASHGHGLFPSFLSLSIYGLVGFFSFYNTRAKENPTCKIRRTV